MQNSVAVTREKPERKPRGPWYARWRVVFALAGMWAGCAGVLYCAEELWGLGDGWLRLLLPLLLSLGIGFGVGLGARRWRWLTWVTLTLGGLAFGAAWGDVSGRWVLAPGAELGRMQRAQILGEAFLELGDWPSLEEVKSFVEEHREELGIADWMAELEANSGSVPVDPFNYYTLLLPETASHLVAVHLEAPSPWTVLFGFEHVYDLALVLLLLTGGALRDLLERPAPRPPLVVGPPLSLVDLQRRRLAPLRALLLSSALVVALSCWLHQLWPEGLREFNALCLQGLLLGVAVRWTGARGWRVALVVALYNVGLTWLLFDGLRSTQWGVGPVEQELRLVYAQERQLIDLGYALPEDPDPVLSRRVYDFLKALHLAEDLVPPLPSVEEIGGNLMQEVQVVHRLREFRLRRAQGDYGEDYRRRLRRLRQARANHWLGTVSPASFGELLLMAFVAQPLLVLLFILMPSLICFGIRSRQGPVAVHQVLGKRVRRP